MFKKSIWKNLQLIENTLPNKSGNAESLKNNYKIGNLCKYCAKGVGRYIVSILTHFVYFPIFN